MTTFLVTLAVLLLATFAMSIGVLMGRKPIAGTCGGMSAIGMEGACEICGGDKSKCEKENETSADESSDSNYYDASDRSSDNK